MRTYWLQRRIGYSTLAATLIVSLSCVIASKALAKYRPPKNPSAPKITVTNTTRGGSCEANSPIGLTALVPISHIGQTRSQHPTFAWFVSDRAPHRLEFRLFTAAGQLLYRTQMQSQLGIMSIALPFDQPGLAIGQSYSWQVVLTCTSNVRVIETADITVIAPPSALLNQLTTAQTAEQRIDRYAESGLWYDALAEARKQSQNQIFVLNLLNSLATSEARSSQESNNSLPVALHAKRLIQIQNFEQQRQEQR